MDLKEAKQKIRLIPTKGAEENTAKCQGWIQMDDDCFGIGYYQDGVSHKYCDECTIKAELDGRVAPLNVFCKELSPKVVEGTKPKATLQEKLEQLKALRERMV